MATDDLSVRFGAETGSLVSGLNAAGNAVKSSVGGMTSALGSLNGVFDTFFGKLTKIIGALAGGAAFKSFIDSTNEMNAESTKLAMTLGITGEEASGLRVALGDVRITTDEYLGTMQKFQRQLRSNEQTLIDNGIKTRDASGHLRDSKTLMAEALQVVNSYKQGVDRNTKSLELFGSRVGDLNKLMKLTPQAIEAAKVKAEQLNLVMTESGRKASSAYKDAMNDVGDVMEGISKTIGEAFIGGQTAALQAMADLGPQLVEATRIMIDIFMMTKEQLLAIFEQIAKGLDIMVYGMLHSLDMLGTKGPSALEIFGNALRILPALLVGFRVAVESVMNVIVSALMAAGTYWAHWAEGVWLALQLDFKGAARAVKKGISEYQSELQAGMDRAKDILLKGKKDLDDILTNPLGVKPQGKPAGRIDTGGNKTNDGTAKEARAKAEAQSKARLALFEEENKNEQAALKDRYANNLITLKQYYDQEMELVRESIDAKIAAQKELIANEPDETKKIALLGQLKVLEEQRKEAFVKNNRDMVNAEKELTNAMITTRSKLQEDLALTQLKNEEGLIKQKKLMHQISAEEELIALKDLEEKRWRIALKGAKERAELISDPAKRAQAYADIERAEAEHNNRILGMARELEAERERLSIETTEAVKASFSTFIQEVASGTKSLRSAFTSMIDSIYRAILKLMADRLVQQFFSGGGTGGSGGAGIWGTMFNAAMSYWGGSGGSGIGYGAASTPTGYGGPYADGGDVRGGMSYLVGERGPEMFVPSTSGTILPNGAGGGAVNVRNVFNLGSPTDLRTQQQIAAITGKSINNALRRNS